MSKSFGKVFDYIKEKFINSVKDCSTKNSELSFKKIDVDKFGTIVGTIYGGLSGEGKWDAYFTDLSSLLIYLQKRGIIGVLIKIDNDVTDDVFVAEFELKLRKDLKINTSK